tara:strand:- start:448 stop:591 length:144 start_codon:yes stop_codon:yes gene_type:complete
MVKILIVEFIESNLDFRGEDSSKWVCATFSTSPSGLKKFSQEAQAKL